MTERKRAPGLKSTPAPRLWYSIRDLVPYRKFPGRRSKLYDWIQRGLFPSPCKTPDGQNAWPASEVDEWNAALIASRDSGEQTKPSFPKKRQQTDAEAAA